MASAHTRFYSRNGDVRPPSIRTSGCPRKPSDKRCDAHGISYLLHTDLAFTCAGDVWHNDSMPSLDELLADRLAAVKELEEKQRSLQSATDRTDAARQAVDTAWNAAAGGCALAHANDDATFRDTLARILDDRISGKRDRKLLADWKAGATVAPDTESGAKGSQKGDGTQRRQRKAEVRRELEALSGAELLATLEQAETAQRQEEKEVASAREKVAETSGELRSRDRHWRIVVGLSVLTHARKSPDFRLELDQIFAKRIAKKDRVLLDRWRKQNAPRAESEPTEGGPIRGWVPRKIPQDGAWGAALIKPADMDLPANLVGCEILVTSRKGLQWITKITEVAENNDDKILVRTENRHDLAPGEGATTTPSGADGDDAAAKETASPSSGTDT